VKNGWLPRSADGYRQVINSIGSITGPKTDLRLAILTRKNATMSGGIDLVEDLTVLTRRHLHI
jgi:hypothetical protein